MQLDRVRGYARLSVLEIEERNPDDARVRADAAICATIGEPTEVGTQVGTARASPASLAHLSRHG